MKTLTSPDGREFTLCETRPYTRRDGTSTALEVWSTPCAHPCCTASLFVKVPAGSTQSKAFGAKHCPAHKLSRAECLTRAAAARKIKRVSTFS